jgi:hypothetical protein
MSFHEWRSRKVNRATETRTTSRGSDASRYGGQNTTILYRDESRYLLGHGDCVMSGWTQRAYDRWRDVDGIHVPVGARVEQTGTDARLGALRSWLHRQGHVTSRGATRLVVRFDGEDQTVTIRPHLIRVINRDDCDG